MKTPQFNQDQYISEGVLNQGASDTLSSIQDIGANLHTPGLVNPSSIVFAFNNTLTVGVTTPSSFSILFGNGTIAYGLGNTDGTTSTLYSVDFTSVVPASGSVTAYIIASLSTINQNSYINSGPPIGHPDYSATFIPSVEYETSQYTLTIAASTTAPDNVTTFSLGQVTLNAGQSGITSLTYTWQYASSILSPNGVVAGLYNYANVTVDDTGRITNISATTNTAKTNIDNNFSVAQTVPNASTSGQAINLGQAQADFAALNGNSAEIFDVANSASATQEAIPRSQGDTLYSPLVTVTAGTTYSFGSMGSGSTTSTSYTQVVATHFWYPGGYTVISDFTLTGAGNEIYYQIYKNGAPYGTVHTSTASSGSFTDDITVVAGDEIGIYLHNYYSGDTASVTAANVYSAVAPWAFPFK